MAARGRSAAGPARAAEEHRRPEHQQDVAQDRPDDRGLDHLVQPGAEREQGDDQLRRVTERDVEQATDARTRPGGELLGRPAHERGGRDDPQRRSDERRHRAGMHELEDDRDRDEGHQQVRPALAGHEESTQVHGRRRRLLAQAGGDCAWSASARRSIGAVRRPSVALVATVLALLLAPVAAHAQAPRTVPSELDALLAAGAIDQLHHDAWAESYDNAKATLKKLHGTRRRQLDAVIANTRTIAEDGPAHPHAAPRSSSSRCSATAPGGLRARCCATASA